MWRPVRRPARAARLDGSVQVGEDGVEVEGRLRLHQEPFTEARSAESAR